MEQQYHETMNEAEKLQELMTAIKEMRRLQKEYFKTRDKSVLFRSKLQEKKVDLMIREYEDSQTALNFMG